MSESLDELVARLAQSPTDRTLDGFEASIGRSIDERRRQARTSARLAPARVASVGVALVMGIATGGAVAASAVKAPRTYASFSTAPDFAPSTLLEGRE